MASKGEEMKKMMLNKFKQITSACMITTSEEIASISLSEADLVCLYANLFYMDLYY